MSDTESIYDEETASQTSLDDLRQRLEEKRDILEDMGYDFDDVTDMDEDEILDLLELAEQEEDLNSDEESDFEESEEEDSPPRRATRPVSPPRASTSRPSTSASTSRPSTSASTSRPSTSAIPPRPVTSRVVPAVAPVVPPRVVPTAAPTIPPRAVPPRPSFVPSRRPTDIPVKEIEPSRPATKYVKPIIDTSRVDLDDAWSEIDWDEAVIDNFGLVSELATALKVPKGSVKQMATRMKQKMSAYFQFRNEAGEKINATAARKLNEILEKQKSYL